MQKALVAVDYSRTSRALVLYAFKYARRNGLGHLDFIHVWEKKNLNLNKWDPVERSSILTEKDLRKKFASLVEESVIHEGGLDTTYSFIITYGIPCEEIISRAEKERYEILLIGQRGVSDVKNFFIGSVTAKVVRHSPCTVLVYQEKPKNKRGD